MTRSARRAGVEIRVGLHTGEVEMEGTSARGVAVHAAARVMSFARASQVLVSWTTKDLLEGAGLALEDAGAHELKGLDGKRHLFSVVAPGPTPD
jgi:class 3 adenylate cyclase